MLQPGPLLHSDSTPGGRSAVDHRALLRPIDSRAHLPAALGLARLGAFGVGTGGGRRSGRHGWGRSTCGTHRVEPMPVILGLLWGAATSRRWPEVRVDGY